MEHTQTKLTEAVLDDIKETTLCDLTSHDGSRTQRRWMEAQRKVWLMTYAAVLFPPVPPYEEEVEPIAVGHHLIRGKAQASPTVGVRDDVGRWRVGNVTYASDAALFRSCVYIRPLDLPALAKGEDALALLRIENEQLRQMLRAWILPT